MSSRDRPPAPVRGAGRRPPTSRSPDVADAVAERVEACVPPGAALCVGLSGGLDSSVLLAGLAARSARLARPLRALHVHHGLSTNADAWAAHCERVCAALGVPLAVARVAVDRRSSLGLEAAARAARYAVFAQRPEPFVALAHHREDQAETVLLQLVRGAGVKGLAAMPESRSLGPGAPVLLRPLLGIPRPALRAWAARHGLEWIEDESNACRDQDRNFLRAEVLPRIAERFPAWDEAFARSARHAASAAELLDALATLDGAPPEAGRDLELRASLGPSRRANVLRAFLARNGLPMPSQARLEDIARQLFGARADAALRLEHGGAVLRRHRGRARLVAATEALAPWRVAWKGEPGVVLPAGLGEVRFEPARGEGLEAAKARGRGWHFAPRRGGERLRLAPGRPSRTLKNLLREAGVAAWRRDSLPLLFHGERLVWAPGVGIDADYACPPGADGLSPSWAVAGDAPL